MSSDGRQVRVVLADIPGLIEGVQRARSRPPVPPACRTGSCAAGSARPRPMGRRDAARAARRAARRVGLVLSRPARSPRPSWAHAPIWSSADFDGLVVSSVTRAGVPQVLGALTELVREAASTRPRRGRHHPPAGGQRVSIDASTTARGMWSVVPLSAVALSDLTNEEALEFAQQRLTQLGVDAALRRAVCSSAHRAHRRLQLRLRGRRLSRAVVKIGTRDHRR